MGELILVHWHEAEAAEMADELRTAGWSVKTGIGDMKEIKAHPPTAVVISLRRLPSHGREVADALWYTKWGRAIPIVFFDGELAKIEATRARFPDAHFVSWSLLLPTLEAIAAKKKEATFAESPEPRPISQKRPKMRSRR